MSVFPSVSDSAQPWFSASPSGDVMGRLFCWPFAGGGASLFNRWQSCLPSTWQVCPIQLPGRENRLAEAPGRVLVDLAEQVATQLLPWLDRPFVFFGHSFGALLAFEVTRQLRRRGNSLPSRLMVAAFCCPQISPFHQRVSELGNDELLHWLRELGGDMDKALANPEWQDLLLPTLRADLEAIEGYCYTSEPPLVCPITAFAGRGDKIAPWNQMIGWRRQTSGSFNQHVIDGQHLFLRTAHTPLINLVRKELPALS